jgi:hypothetical protein
MSWRLTAARRVQTKKGNNLHAVHQLDLQCDNLHLPVGQALASGCLGLHWPLKILLIPVALTAHRSVSLSWLWTMEEDRGNRDNALRGRRNGSSCRPL